MLNQSNQRIIIPGGTVVGTATPLDHPDAPAIICDWSEPIWEEEFVIEDVNKSSM